MKPVKDGDRIVANIHHQEYVPFEMESGESSGSVLQLDNSNPPGVGFHIYKMEPGLTTTPHQHTSNEEFLVISGEVIDNDGTIYRQGDLVLMKKGTEHSSYTRDGCMLAVYIKTPEVDV